MPDVIRNNFTSGELDPSLHHRPELDQYQSGARHLSNFIVKPQGGLRKRQGTRVLGGFLSANFDIILPFIFNENENYIVGVFSNGTVEISTVAGELATIVGESGLGASGLNIRDIDFAQNADVMVVTTGKAPPTFIKRISTSPLTFEIERAKFEPLNKPPTLRTGSAENVKYVGRTNLGAPPGGTSQYAARLEVTFSRPTSSPRPAFKNGDSVTVWGFWDPNDEASVKVRKDPVLLEASASDEYTGAPLYRGVEYEVILTGESDPFGSLPYPDFGDKGFMRGGGATAGSPTSEKDVTNSYVVTSVIDGEETYPSAPVDVSSKALDSAYGVRLSWVLQEDPKNDGEISHYRVYKETPFGSGTYGWIGDAVSNSFTDFNLAGVTSDTPPRDFFSPKNPRAVAFYQQRLVYGGDSDSPLALTATATGSFTDVTHRRPPGASDAFRLGISASKFDRVQHLESTDTLIILSAGGIWRTTEGESEKFTPETTTVRKISSFGADGVKPVHAGSSVLYSQAGATRIRDLFAPSNPQGENSDITILCPHLFEDKEVLQLAYSENPTPVVWALVADRKPSQNINVNPRHLYAMSYDREQGVNAWSRISFGATQVVAYKLYESTVLGVRRNDRFVLTMGREIRGVTVLPSPQGDRVVLSMNVTLRRHQQTWLEHEAAPDFPESGGVEEKKWTVLEEFSPENSDTLDFCAVLSGTNVRRRAKLEGGEQWWDVLQEIESKYVALGGGSWGDVVEFMRPTTGIFVGITSEGTEVPLTGTEETGNSKYLYFGGGSFVEELLDEDQTADMKFDPHISRVGLKFSSRAELLPVVGAETPHRAMKSVNRVSLWVKDTTGPLWVGQLKLNPHGTGTQTQLMEWNSVANEDEVAVPGESLWEIGDRLVADEYGGPYGFTGLLETEVIGNWDEQGTVAIEHRGSGSCEILAVEFDVDA